MKLSAPISSREYCLPDGNPPMAFGAGRVVVELGCWIIGVALIATYLAASTSLENQRRQGIELFAQARGTAIASHRLEGRLPVGQATMPAPSPAFAADAASLPIAVLRIGRVGVEVPVYSDLSELNLSRGAGWIGGTAAPNTGGNMAVAAHRDRYFRPLKDIVVGDILELESLSGYGEFRVSRIAIVDPDDVSALDDTTLPTLTLVTCYPFYFIGNAPQRYIVQATAVEQPGKTFMTDAVPSARKSGDTP